MKRGLLARACALLLALALPAGAEMVTLQSALTGQAVGVDAAGLLAVRPGPALTLDMIRLNGNRVAFRDPQSGLFLRAGIGARTQLGIASEHIRAWETFELHQTGAGVSLRSVQSGAWVGFDGVEPRLNARWGTQGRGQTFHLVPAGGAAQARASVAFAGLWALDQVYDDRGRVVPVDFTARPGVWLRVQADGALEGYSGCNTFSARLRAVRGGYRVEDFLTTRVGCSGPARTIERLYFSALNDGTTVEESRGRLVIRDASGQVLAYFVPR